MELMQNRVCFVFSSCSYVIKKRGNSGKTGYNWTPQSKTRPG